MGLVVSRCSIHSCAWTQRTQRTPRTHWLDASCRSSSSSQSSSGFHCHCKPLASLQLQRYGGTSPLSPLSPFSSQHPTGRWTLQAHSPHGPLDSPWFSASGAVSLTRTVLHRSQRNPFQTQKSDDSDHQESNRSSDAESDSSTDVAADASVSVSASEPSPVPSFGNLIVPHHISVFSDSGSLHSHDDGCLAVSAPNFQSFLINVIVGFLSQLHFLQVLIC